MAKLKAPLLSLGAAGALGKALVFFPWKGIDCVREYVVPSNPKTTEQTTQRGYITAAVAMIHTAQARALNALTEADQIAYSTLATAKGIIMTWFNAACKLWLDVAVALKTPIIYSDGETTDTLRTSVDVILRLNEETASDLAAGTFFFGKSKTNLIHSYAANVNVSNYVSLINTGMSSWIAAGDKIYWQFRPNVADPCEGANSGIYSFVAT